MNDYSQDASGGDQIMVMNLNAIGKLVHKLNSGPEGQAQAWIENWLT